jgi:hypothetical protein
MNPAQQAETITEEIRKRGLPTFPPSVPPKNVAEAVSKAFQIIAGSHGAPTLLIQPDLPRGLGLAAAGNVPMVQVLDLGGCYLMAVAITSRILWDLEDAKGGAQ